MSLSKRQVIGHLNEETVLLNLKDDGYYTLNESASFLWNLLRHPITVADLTARLRDEYSLVYDRAERDVVRFLESAREAKLLEVHADI